MKTKIYLLWVTLLLSIAGFAQSGTDGTVTWSLNNGTLTIGGSGNMKSYWSKSAPWASYKSQITSVNIQSVTSVGEQAFIDHRNLSSVTIGNSVTLISSAAFMACNNLTEVTIPNSVTKIEESAFSGCSNMVKVTISNSVTEIEPRTFYGCSSLAKVTIPSLVTSIGDYAFQNCKSLTEVTIPNSVTSIGDAAFMDCWTLISVCIPNLVTTIPFKSFYNCYDLTSVIIPNSVTEIQFHAFYGCGKLTDLTIPNSVTTIGNAAFFYCSKLTEVTIPNSVTTIGEAAFSNCSKLAEVTISNSVTTIGAATFSYCSKLTEVTIPNSVTSIGAGAFSYCSSLASVTIPNSVTSIGEDAFERSGLTEITIPASVTSIGEYTFRNCTSITTITNYNPTPQSIKANVFFQLALSNIALIVPFGSGELYEKADVWKDFKIKEDQVNIEVTDNSAEVSWPVLEDTESYILYLYDDVAHQNKLAEYQIDKEGNLLRSLAATEETMSFTIPDLSADTDYYYKLVSLDAEENILRSSSDSFSTNIVTGMKDVTEAGKEIAVYPNPTTGMVYIEMEDDIKMYDSQGILLKEAFGKQADLSSYPVGLYYIKTGNRTAKVIKQ